MEPPRQPFTDSRLEEYYTLLAQRLAQDPSRPRTEQDIAREERIRALAIELGLI
jgi:hypothetical protein